MFQNRDNYKSRQKTIKRDQSISVLDDTNPVIVAFRNYAAELDNKHDKYERIVKLSRDITIESKRIIFLLHNTDKENKRDCILQEAETRLNKLIANNFQIIAAELENEDLYQYLRAYTGGIQEFIEAYTFYTYLKKDNIEHWKPIVSKLEYNIEVKLTSNDTETSCAKKTIKVPLPAVEYILGLGDLSGELMRKCINNLGSGNLDDCFKLCNFVKQLYEGFLMVGGMQGYKEIGRKIYTLKQSLYKMELVCYNITVRGKEVPRHMLGSIIPSAPEVPIDVDEGFY